MSEREDGGEGWGNRLYKLPLLIIDARARRALRRANGHNNQDRIALVNFQRGAVRQCDPFVHAVLLQDLRVSADLKQLSKQTQR